MKKYILITGGNSRNKGAQAMLFTTVNEMKERFPGCECILFSNIDAKKTEDTENYSFQVKKRLSKKQSHYLMSPFLRSMIKDRSYLEYYENALLQVDISGYALGSNWGFRAYIRNILTAKAFGIPFFILPQSFGPFDFTGLKGKMSDALIEFGMKYPKMIFAREKEGYDLLKNRYHLNNVYRSADLVLQSRGFHIENVYKKVPELYNPDIAENSVAVIPNQKNNIYGNSKDILDAYYSMIDALLEKGRNIYLVYHSTEDEDLCRTIKNQYSGDGRVIFIDRELSCVEFSNIISRFDFVIASRYHSIIHAYRNYVPAIIIGWAVKYHELAGLFSQTQYHYDVRKSPDRNELLEMLNKMDCSWEKESQAIRDILLKIQEENVYDRISEEMRTDEQQN